MAHLSVTNISEINKRIEVEVVCTILSTNDLENAMSVLITAPLACRHQPISYKG